MKIDYEIECIQNGYIATGNDSTKCKTFYKSIEEFLSHNTTDKIKELQNTHFHHHIDGKKYRITMSIDEVETL